jgi:hypothetical protein
LNDVDFIGTKFINLGTQIKALAMKEFMLMIRNIGDAKDGLSHEEHLAFVKACEVYIGELTASGNMMRAQPLLREGVIISGTPGYFNEEPYDRADEISVGYYHVLAKDLDKAIAIAKRNPEFAYSSKAVIEVRPMKMKEETTAFVYPKG